MDFETALASFEVDVADEDVPPESFAAAVAKKIGSNTIAVVKIDDRPAG